MDESVLAASENISNLLPYDYVRDRMIIAIEADSDCKIYSPNKLDLNTYQELSRFLNRRITISHWSAEEFNEMLT